MWCGKIQILNMYTVLFYCDSSRLQMNVLCLSLICHTIIFNGINPGPNAVNMTMDTLNVWVRVLGRPVISASEQMWKVKTFCWPCSSAASATAIDSYKRAYFSISYVIQHVNGRLRNSWTNAICYLAPRRLITKRDRGSLSLSWNQSITKVAWILINCFFLRLLLLLFIPF